jgi:hypothetical protein
LETKRRRRRKGYQILTKKEGERRRRRTKSLFEEKHEIEKKDWLNKVESKVMKGLGLRRKENLRK